MDVDHRIKMLTMAAAQGILPLRQGLTWWCAAACCSMEQQGGWSWLDGAGWSVSGLVGLVAGLRSRGFSMIFVNYEVSSRLNVQPPLSWCCGVLNYMVVHGCAVRIAGFTKGPSVRD